jgi:hypothetical protein
MASLWPFIVGSPRLGVSVLVLLTPIGTVVSQSRNPIVTDRPDFTESTLVVGRGVVQVEGGITRSRDDGDHSHTVAFPEGLVRFGVSAAAELRLGTPNRIDPSAGTSGWDGNWSAGVKLQMLQTELTGVAVLGTASWVKGGNEPDYSVRAAVSHQAGPVSLAAMMSLILGEGTTTEQTLVGSLPFASSGAVFLEYAGHYGESTGAQHLAHLGAAWQLGEDLQVDVHGGWSLRGAADPFVGAGVAVRFK